MAIDAYGNNLATTGVYDNATTSSVENKTELKTNDFMTLLLVEMQNQDPTEPMDSDKILSQTSQLATLESADNTNKTLSDLSASLASSQQFSSISAIGKTADLGSNAITYEDGTTSSFEVYFPEDIESGNIEILDVNGNTISTMEIEPNSSGTYQFDWDGALSSGSEADSGVYYVTASYKNPDGQDLTTRMGTYPIESVRFENGDSLVKVGSSYVSLNNIKEIY